VYTAETPPEGLGHGRVPKHPSCFGARAATCIAMPKQGNASLVLAECERALRLCLNILKLIVKGQVPSLQQHVICQLRHVQRRVQSHSHSELQRSSENAPVVCSVWSVLTFKNQRSVGKRGEQGKDLLRSENHDRHQVAVRIVHTCRLACNKTPLKSYFLGYQAIV